MAKFGTRRLSAVALTVCVLLGVAPLSTAGASTNRAEAPVLGIGGADSIVGRYIVVLDDSAPQTRIADVAALATAAGGAVRHTYNATIKGFSAALPASALAAVRAASGVKYVQADGRVQLADRQVNPPSWGLDRVDQRDLPRNNVYSYATSAGAGVDLYVIDSGIRVTHSDFGGRASSGVDFIDGGTADDCHGHGTHVAGTAGGNLHGVAKRVSLIAVRVLDCDGFGSWESIIAGVDWVTANHSGPSVANMSIQGVYNQAVNDAVTASIAAGVVQVLAAGNYADDACEFSPGSTPLAITLGASDSNDIAADFSNYGPCLDLWAPGVYITSAWHTTDTASNVLQGTSMASPHAAGVAAIYLGIRPSASPAMIRNKMVSNASLDKLALGFGDGSPNKLLFSKVTK